MKKYIFIAVFLLSCSTKLSDIDWNEIVKTCKEAYEECKEEEPTPSPEPTIEPSLPPIEPTPVPSTEPDDDFFIPLNCSNPPEHLSSNDGFKCMASATQNGSVVCLLPYQFTWKPWKMVTDHHNYTFACNKNDEHFDKVFLLLKNNRRIDLQYSGCHNYVATSQGWIGRQHFRNKNIQWDDIKNQVERIVMIKNQERTCLKF